MKSLSPTTPGHRVSDMSFWYSKNVLIAHDGDRTRNLRSTCTWNTCEVLHRPGAADMPHLHEKTVFCAWHHGHQQHYHILAQVALRPFHPMGQSWRCTARRGHIFGGKVLVYPTYGSTATTEKRSGFFVHDRCHQCSWRPHTLVA